MDKITVDVSALSEESNDNRERVFRVEFSELVNADWLIFHLNELLKEENKRRSKSA